MGETTAKQIALDSIQQLELSESEWLALGCFGTALELGVPQALAPIFSLLAPSEESAGQ